MSEEMQDLNPQHPEWIALELLKMHIESLSKQARTKACKLDDLLLSYSNCLRAVQGDGVYTP